MLKKKLNILASIVAITITLSIFIGITISHKLNAETVLTGMIYEDSFDTEIKDNWSLEKNSFYSNISVSGGQLIANNESGIMEFAFSTNTIDGFVMEFDATRLSGNGYFGIKYSVQTDSTGYESRIYTSQSDGKSPGVYYEEHGKAVEFREVNYSNVNSGAEKSIKRGFNFFVEEIKINKTYHYVLAVNNSNMELFIDGIKILNEYIEEGFESGKIVFRLSENMKFAFDNLKVYSPIAYAQKQIDTFGEPDSLSDDKILSLEKDILNLKSYCNKILTEEELSKLENKTLFEKLVNRYQGLIAPKIYLNGSIKKTIDAGTTVTILTAKAYDRFNNQVKVKTEVIFGDKQVKITDGTFTANEIGKYTLKFTARDYLGNTTCRQYEITVR